MGQVNKVDGDPWPHKDHWVRPVLGQTYERQGHLLVAPDEALLMGSYSIEEENRRLQEEERKRSGTIDPKSGRPGRRRSFSYPGLVTALARLPVAGERKQHYGKERTVSLDEAAEAYLEWLNRWGSLGILYFRFEALGAPEIERTRPAPLEDQDWRDRRTGERLRGQELVPAYLREYRQHFSFNPGTRYHHLLERISIMEMSQEIYLLRCALTLATYLAGSEDDEGRPPWVEAALAAEVLVGQIGLQMRPQTVWDANKRIHTCRNDPRLAQQVWPHDPLEPRDPLSVVLAFWLHLHRTSDLDVKPSTGKDDIVFTLWRHRSFLAALYHLLVIELSGGARLRRCPSCGSFFQPKRDAVYCSERCYDRERKRRGSAR